MINLKEYQVLCMKAHQNEPKDIATKNFEKDIKPLMEVLSYISVAETQLRLAKDKLTSIPVKTSSILGLGIRLDYYLSELSEYNADNIQKEITQL